MNVHAHVYVEQSLFLAGHSGRLNHYRILGQVVWIQNYFKYLCILTVYIVYLWQACVCCYVCFMVILVLVSG